eukprot:scaffold323390_cov24-Tisochrysis_lutea.AAC.5
MDSEQNTPYPPYLASPMAPVCPGPGDPIDPSLERFSPFTFAPTPLLLRAAASSPKSRLPHSAPCLPLRLLPPCL